MQSGKSLIAAIKSKLDELEEELDGLEMRAASEEGDVEVEAERHRLSLEELLMDVQQRLDEVRELAGSDGLVMEDAWQQMEPELESLGRRLYAGN
ncbi:hypothetical protein A11A3_13250 [Alcanivorax hongdengensis A-11-3]|uniref:Uncharacterized protein n=1 Tax=Alcanivorax hongdengensis A-11-3 TaxID=1177179 RepID=L0W991_9GAMM|nr:hypothetical protein [Alcanivorax hongdengensis]EKF73506.1 hypothetical protein A11A3_13250 [Alcanivorax hongdengensis A-11-3]